MRFPIVHICHNVASGQAGMVAIAVTVMVAMVLLGASLTGLSQMNATRPIAVKQSLQTYYAAQAGIQEALATRMLPRSNTLNFVSGLPTNVEPYFRRSGLVYQDPVNSQQLVGRYEYVVVGGDSARRANGNYYDVPSGPPYSSGNINVSPDSIPRLLTTATIPPESPFVIISRGITCKVDGGDENRRGLTGVDLLDSDGNCPTGYVRDELTLVSHVELAQEYTGNTPPKDRLVSMRTFKNSQVLRLPVSAFVPGYGWTGTNTDVDFDRVWSVNSSSANSPTRLRKVVFYDFLTNEIYANHDVTGLTTTVSSNVPSRAVMRLYFDGPVDYRSISRTYDRSLSDCKGASAATSCNIRVVDRSTGDVYGGNAMIPLFPGSTQIILLPPLRSTISGSTPHELIVDTEQIRSYSLAEGPGVYRVRFNTI